MLINQCFKNENKISVFDIQKFYSPDRFHSPIYSWVWNGKCSKEETKQQIETMYNAGIKAFYIIPEPKEFRPVNMPTYLEPDYLSDEYMDQYLYAIEIAKEKNMMCWIYDEGGWPSGGACGQVVDGHPEMRMSFLQRSIKTFKKGDIYKKSNNNIIAAFVNDSILIDENYKFKKKTNVFEYFYMFLPYVDKNQGVDNPDMLYAPSTERFLELTHEKYKKYLENYFGDTISCVFSDEPKCMGGAIPFRPELKKEFEEKYSISLDEYLPILYKKIRMYHSNEKIPQECDEIFIKWFDFINEKFCQNYLLKEKDWSNKNNLLFTGHLDRDHDPLGCFTGCNFNAMRSLRCFDVPGIDVIWRQIFPRKDTSGKNDEMGYNGFFPRYASSAANQINSNYSMTESFGVYGFGTSFEQMKYVINYQAVRGINIFNIMLMSYNKANNSIIDEPPVFSTENPLFKDISAFNKYIERLSYLVSVGNEEKDIALYYPIFDLLSLIDSEKAAKSYENLGRSAEAKMLDFDIFDDDVIESADETELSNGIISIGKARYKILLIGLCKHMNNSTIQKIETFIKNGGLVYQIKDKHSININGAIIINSANDLPIENKTVFSESDKIRIAKRTTDNGDFLLIFNESENTEKVNVITNYMNCYNLSVTDGCVRQVKKLETNSFEVLSGDILVLLFTKEIIKCSDENLYNNCFTINEFSISKDTQYYYLNDEQKISIDNFEENFSKTELGCWSKVVGKNFSGTCKYMTTFSLDNIDKNIKISLGKVNYSARVFINGNEIGTCIMNPYEIVVSKKFLKKDNKLEIFVTNTISNELLDKLSESIPENGYYKKTIEFDKEMVDSGLFGPVKVYF